MFQMVKSRYSPTRLVMSAARGQALLASGSLLACAALLSLCATPALAQNKGGRSDRPSKTVPREVQELWSEYPLNPGRSPATPSRTSTTESGAARQPSTAGEERDSTARRILRPLAFTLVGFLSVLAVALFLGLRLASVPARPRRLPRRRERVSRARRLLRRSTRPPLGGLEMNDFVRRLFDSGRKRRHARVSNLVAESTSEAAASATRQDIFAPYTVRGRGRSDTLKRSEHPTPESGTGEAGEGLVEAERGEPTEVGLGEEDYAQVGEQVTAVLTSAQQGAEQIRDSARREAELIRAEANDKATAMLAEATLDAEQMRRESEELRAEADRYGKESREAADRYLEETRRESDQEAARRRAEVDEQVRGIHQAAEQKAKDLETEALERQKAFVLEAGRSEARLEQLLGVFRGMTSQLEELVQGEQARKSGEAEGEEPDGELLDELLTPGSSRSRSG
jgi:F0F1-type ATP synthase membrane subunit b/b'